jgi:hypothetical protein
MVSFIPGGKSPGYSLDRLLVGGFQGQSGHSSKLKIKLSLCFK